jgi:predicted ribonuclease YlaK
MQNRGKTIYIPRVVITEMEDIKREENIGRNSIAMRRLVQHARAGREVERILKLDWSKARLLPKIDYPKKMFKTMQGKT